MRSLLLGILISLTAAAQAQDMRYFQFTTSCGHGNWQDTAYIAATNDPAVIADVMTELDKPFDTRIRFVAGKITYGHGGYNHNAGHWFRWHFIPNEWRMVEMAIEVCDGCPYSDIDADTAYWVKTVKEYCSWGGRLVKEVPKPLGIPETQENKTFNLYPNPASGMLHIDKAIPAAEPLSIFSTTGREVLVTTIQGRSATVDISAIPNGMYFLRLGEGETIQYGRLVVEK